MRGANAGLAVLTEMTRIELREAVQAQEMVLV